MSDTSDRTERNAHVAQTTHQTILTTLDDTVDTQTISESTSLITPAHKGADPYVDSGLTEVLTRLYKIGTYAWSPTDTVDTQLAQINFPYALFNTTILDRLVHFKYFRAAVEVTIRLNSTMFHRGLLQISNLPHWNPAVSNGPTFGAVNPFSGYFVESRLPNVIMSANTAEAVTFTIPYVAPSAYCTIINSSFAAESVQGFFGTCSIRVLIPLACGTNVAPISVSVYARFVEPQVAGPIHYQSNLVSQGTEMTTFYDNQTDESIVETRTEEDKANSLGMVSEQRKRTLQGTQAEVAPAKKPSTGSQVMRTLGAIASKFVDAIPKYVTAFAPLLLFDMPTSTKAHEPMVIRSGANFCPMKGLDSAIMMSLDPENKVANDPKIFCDKHDYNLFSNYKLLPSLLAVEYIDPAKVSGDVIYSFPVNPMYVYNILGSGVHDFYPTHLSTLASLFRAWRGDIKYRIYFSASHFVSCRIRIEWLPDIVYTTTVSGEMQGNNINKVVDINGDTIVDFDVPFLQTQHWLPVSDYKYVTSTPETGSNGSFRFTIVNATVSANSNVTANQIWFAIWISGGEDFQVAFPHNMSSVDDYGKYYFIGQTPPEPEEEELLIEEDVHEQSAPEKTYFDVREVFRKPFPGLVPARSVSIHGFENGENCDSFTEYMKRYTTAQNMLQSAQNWGELNPAPTPGYGPYIVGPFANFVANPTGQYTSSSMAYQLFLFQRGGMRYKLVNTTQTSSPVLMSITPVGYNGHHLSPQTENRQEGTFYQNMQLNPILEFQIPFWYPFPFYQKTAFSIEKVNSPGFYIYNHNSNKQYYAPYRAIADDFSQAWPLGCPPVRWVAPAP